MKKYIILIVTFVIVFLIVAGVIYLNGSILPYLADKLGKKNEVYLDTKDKVQIVNNLSGLSALFVGISGLILFSKENK